MVPKDWNSVYLNDIADKIMVGIASAATHAYTNIGIRMLRNLNIKEGFIDDSDILFVNEEYELQHKNKRLKAGDILTVRTGYPGLSAVVPKKYDNAQCFTSLITRLKEDVALSDYICRFINSEYGKKYISSGEAGGAQKNVNASILKKMLIPLPPLPEQRKIAKILSTWDKAISTTERLIDNSKQQKKALMQQLLTGKKRLLDDSSKPFEGEWEETHLEKACSVNPKKSAKPVDGLVSFVPMDAVSEDTKLIRHEMKRYDAVSKGFTSFVNQDCLVAKITPCFENGKGAYVDNLRNGIGFGSTEFHVLRAREGNCTKFIYYITQTREFRVRGEMNMQGSAGQKRVTTDYLKLFKVSIPPTLVEQQKVASVLSNADQEIELLEQQLTDLKQEKKALMQQLLTGKRRVKINDKEVV